MCNCTVTHIPLSRKKLSELDWGGNVSRQRRTGMSALHVRLGDQIQECPVYAGVFAEFWMESCGHNFSLAHGDGIVAFGGDDFYVWTNALDFRRADEDHFDRIVTQSTFPDGAVDLPSVGVAADADIEHAESGLLRILHFVS